MKVEKVTIHCSATPNGKTISIDAMTKDHIAKGFGGAGYHVVIQPDGTRVHTRGLNQKGAHVKGHNEGNIGICLVGTDKFSKAQFDILHSTLEDMRRCHNWLQWNLFCHHEFDTAKAQGKTCPNIDPKRLLYWYLTGDFRAVVIYT